MRYGKVPEPLEHWYPHGGVFWTWSVTESMAEATWRVLPPNLRELAVLKAASLIDCPWCLDFGSALIAKHGIDPDKVRHLHDWRSATVYDEDECLVLTYAEQVSATPAQVDDELVATLRRRLGEQGFVELTASIALEHMRSRFNKAVGAMPQGWSRVCALPTPAVRAG